MSTVDSAGPSIETGGSPRGQMRLRLVKGFLVGSYGIGAPVLATLEYRFGLVSNSLDLPPDVIFLAVAVQLCASVAILFRNAVNLGTALLTVISLGAAAANFRAGWLAAGIAALAYSVIQVWLSLVSCGGLRATRSCGDS